MSLHDDIMNLRCEVPKDANANQALSFKCGHKQARHAAAELANTVDAELERLRARVAELEAKAAQDSPDAERFRWLLDGNGYFMEEQMLCGCGPCSDEEKDKAKREIDDARNFTVDL